MPLLSAIDRSRGAGNKMTNLFANIRYISSLCHLVTKIVWPTLALLKLNLLSCARWEFSISHASHSILCLGPHLAKI